MFLDLRVKVNPDWRNNERTLDELGVPKRTAKPSEDAEAATSQALISWNFSAPPTEYPVSTSKPVDAARYMPSRRAQDGELMRRVAAGDAEAFAQLFRAPPGRRSTGSRST